MHRILYALTSHGLGHLTRSLAIARELRVLYAQVEIVVATSIPEARVARDLPGPFTYRAVDYEPGTRQRTCFELDLDATRQAYRQFMAERDARLRAEERYLRETGCSAVVSDIPALPVCAAARAGLPAIGIANFTWDWILEPLFAGHDTSVPERLAADYAQGTIHLRLPFGPDSSPFPRSEAAPLVSRRATLDAASLRASLGIPAVEAEALVVVCPGGWDPAAWSLIHVPDCQGLRFVAVGNLPITADAPIHALPHDLPPGIAFPDLVAAADVVLAKPGYGIASECASHGTALVSIERPGFREAPVLLDTFRALGPCTEMSLPDFFAGRWEAPLHAALESRAGWTDVPHDGARRVARRLGELLELSAPDREGAVG